MKTKQNEKFAIRRDPGNESNFGIIWETNGTEGGFTSETAARESAVGQSGIEADESESSTWEW